MKDYDETIRSVFEKGDRLIEIEKKRSIRIRRIAFSVSGMCAAVIVGVGIWHNSALRNGMNNNFDRNDIVTATEAATKEVSTAVVTEDVTEFILSTAPQTTAHSGTSSVSTAITVQSVSSQQSVTSRATSSKSADIPEKTTQQTTPPPPDTTIPATAAHTTTTVQTHPDTAVVSANTTTKKPSVPSNMVTVCPTESPTVATDTFEINVSEFKSCSVEGLGDFLVADTEKPANDTVNINEFICEYFFSYTAAVNGESVQKPLRAEIYSVGKMSPRAVIAVKFDTLDGYYIYVNKDCGPQTIGEWLAFYDISEENFSGTVRYNTNNIFAPAQTYQVADPGLILGKLQDIADTPGISDKPDKNAEHLDILLTHPDFYVWGDIRIYTNGYICINGSFGYSAYKTDEEQARAIIDDILILIPERTIDKSDDYNSISLCQIPLPYVKYACGHLP